MAEEDELAQMRIMVTGHRPNKLWGYDLSEPHYVELKNKLKTLLIENNADTAISGMALGVDTIFAQAALELGIKLVCAIPCLEHSSQWYESSVNEYNRILSLAYKTVIVTNQPYAPQFMQTRNKWMVDHADIAIAVWDGTSGGTANCLKYIKTKQLKLYTISPKDILTLSKGGRTV